MKFVYIIFCATFFSSVWGSDEIENTQLNVVEPDRLVSLPIAPVHELTHGELDISIYTIIENMKAQLPYQEPIYKISIFSCALENEGLEYFYENFLKEDPSLKESVIFLNFSYGSIDNPPSPDLIFNILNYFPNLKFLNLTFWVKIEHLSDFLKSLKAQYSNEAFYLNHVKKIIFMTKNEVDFYMKTPDRIALFEKLVKDEHLPANWKKIHKKEFPKFEKIKAADLPRWL